MQGISHHAIDTDPSPIPGKTGAATLGEWGSDRLGDDYSSLTIDLGDDPEGEGHITATLVRYDPAVRERPRAVVLWVHGFTDYFFHSHVAERLSDESIATYGLDLRKCGRSLRPGMSAHYSTNLSRYGAELDAAIAAIRADTSAPIVPICHSTGGLIVPLWLADRRDAGAFPDVAGLVLNSPWLEFDVDAFVPFRASRIMPAVDGLIAALGKLAPNRVLPLPTNETYGSSLSSSRLGEFDYERALKPIDSAGVRPGWLAAVRRGQLRLQKGLDLDLPVLMLRSERSSRWRTDADLILDVRSMKKYGPRISRCLTDTPLAGARHDVLLSTIDVREKAVAELISWMDAQSIGV